jgi:SAM-dependent methyltransferase
VALYDEARYGGTDADTAMFFRHFAEPPGSRVLEVGANEEFSAYALARQDYTVVGVDLRDQPWHEPCPYLRLQGDFVELAKSMPAGWFDAAFSTSAIEHFGLQGYLGLGPLDDALDAKTCQAVLRLLKPGGRFYVTVPYGREFFTSRPHWRVYDRRALLERLATGFDVEALRFFKSGDCVCPHYQDGNVWLVEEKDADAYSGTPPHITVLAILRKPEAADG